MRFDINSIRSINGHRVETGTRTIRVNGCWIWVWAVAINGATVAAFPKTLNDDAQAAAAHASVTGQRIANEMDRDTFNSVW